MWKFLPEYKLCSGETQIFQDDQNTLETIKKKQEVWTEYRARHKQLTGVSHVALHGLQLKIGPKSMNWKQACSFSYFQLNSDKSAQQKSVINIAVGRSYFSNRQQLEQQSIQRGDSENKQKINGNFVRSAVVYLGGKRSYLSENGLYCAVPLESRAGKKIRPEGQTKLDIWK